ncbi:carbon-nitrogen family hydrolase [Tuberibacillus sp. Marseille-P3662]|uniref:carbon-nitrogen family hydrolase n=1 Tax=Tuberibacillus sp. Marseille-P3662 TaxID=1965358 RepID=UPI000A1C90CA|nr:carbon-nitrogen family hydrolase [Tuberibacillus sp. Marseille-P3662]
MKYAMYQMDIIPGDPEANRDKIKRWVEAIVTHEKPDTVVLPEMWTTAYTLPELDRIAESNGADTIPFLQDLAKSYHINIIGGSIANQKDGGIYNTALAMNREGELVYQYDKIHLVPMLDEPTYLTGGGDKVQIFELDGVKMGLIICYDLRFPELARKLALEGVQVLHIVAEWPAARRNHWKHLQIARAIENQMFVVSCNRIGHYNDVDFAGSSMVVDPWGDSLVTASADQEETIVASLSMDDVPKVRQNVPIFSSRVPGLY